jgi:hypothetical protein
MGARKGPNPHGSATLTTGTRNRRMGHSQMLSSGAKADFVLRLYAGAEAPAS